MAVKSAATAQKNEANDEPTVITFKGTEYLVPPALDLPIEIMEATGELEVLAIVLGDDQYKVFRDTKPTLRDLKAMSELVANAAGFDSMGE
jgi:hypothetical protein